MRDDFSSTIKEVLARRVNFLCSNPECPLGTVGPHTDDDKAINKGVAAHITAASPGGKRYDSKLTIEERSSAANGIWLCQNCAKLIDSDEKQYTSELLREWKSKAEAAVQQSITSNSALIVRTGPDVRINASYGGGISNSSVHIGIFNASPTPIFLSSWFASFGPEDSGPSTMSMVHTKGRFPVRLEGQNRSDIVVSSVDHPLSELRQLAIVDGNGRWWMAPDSQVALIVQKAIRYASLQPPTNNDTITEEQLKQANIEITATIRDGPIDHKRLEVVFLNRSEHPITLQAAKIKWEFDPPRWHPQSSGSNMKVAEAGGTVSLSSAKNMTSPIEPGGNATFFLHDDLAGVLVETILGDVKDEDIKILVYTNTRIMWCATEDEIPKTIRQFAQYILDTSHARR